MNPRVVIRQLGLLTLVLSLAMVLVALVTGPWMARVRLYEELAFWSQIEAAALGLILGAMMYILGRSSKKWLTRRDALLLVALSWLFGALLAGLPFFLWAHQAAPVDHPMLSFASCYFEAMSGLTTTGATVVPDLTDFPATLLLWRSTTHWLGGLGIVVLFVAVLPTLGVGGKKLFQFEAPGPTKAGVRPRIRESARMLWIIYVSLTLTQIIALKLAGWGAVSWFDAVCHTFATLATGGFGNHNASIAQFDSPAVEAVIVVFMIMAGINFALYDQIVRGRITKVWKDPELRTYLGILLGATVVITMLLWGSQVHPIHPSPSVEVTAAAAYPIAESPGSASPEGESPGSASQDSASPEGESPEGASPGSASPGSASQDSASPEGESPGSASPDTASPEGASPGSSLLGSARYAVFQVVAIMTTTGFATADFEQWPFLAKAILVLLMFVGASAGSTGGGIKVVRILLVVKILLSELRRVFDPNVVQSIRLGKANVEPAMRLSVVGYVLGIVILFVIGAVTLMVLEQDNAQLAAAGQRMDFTTAATASVATLNNIGPGLNLVGATQNYSWFSAPGKIVMSVMMALGRLEVFAILVLLVPAYWRRD